ncbi:hypothetical protein FQN52_000810 [Onygenales sp. PD_12]|nr:hypothetical protein FQN52_000810 [Onygenales sp. PD_12]
MGKGVYVRVSVLSCQGQRACGKLYWKTLTINLDNGIENRIARFLMALIGLFGIVISRDTPERYLGVEEYVDLANEAVFMDVVAPAEPDDRASDADCTIFERKETRYLRKQEAISKVWERIWSSVDRNELDLATRHNKDIKGIVRALHKRLCPTILELQSDVRKRFWTLIEEPDHRSIETWLDSWLMVERDLEDAQMLSSFDLWRMYVQLQDTAYVQGLCSPACKWARRDK